MGYWNEPDAPKAAGEDDRRWLVGIQLDLWPNLNPSGLNEFPST
jgi:hypothetical protein